MHELGITRNIAEIVIREAAGSPVHRVLVAVGELTAVVPESLHFCFDVVARGTLLDGATLEIRKIPGRAWCEECGDEFDMPVTGAACPCGSRHYRLLSGNELRIVEMELRETVVCQDND